MQPLIIEAAINGATPKAMNPNVPRSVDEIVVDACACIDAGAAIIHHHNDEPLLQGRHASQPYLAAWKRIYEHHPGVLLYPTMGGGGPTTNAEERYQHVRELSDAGLLKMSLIDPGSVSLGPVDGDGVPMPIDLVYQNSFADIRFMADFCRERHLAAHVSIFEPGFLRVALAYHKARRFPAALKIQLYFGGDALPFGLPPNKQALDMYVSMLDGTQLPWMVAVIGGNVCDELAEAAIRLGGHVRVGLEDFAGSGQPTNLQLVQEVVAIAARCEREVATPAQAARILGIE